MSTAASTPTPAARATVIEVFNPLQQVGVGLLVIFLFLSFSRVADFGFGYLHLPIVCASLALAAALFSGGLLRAVSSRVGLLLVAFTFWMFVCVPSSAWRGGSVALITDTWIKSLFVFLIIAGLVQNLAACRKAMHTIAWASLAIVALSVLYPSVTSDGRLSLAQGTLANPNDTAQLLLIGLPFWFLMLIGGGRGFTVRKVAAIFAAPLVMYVTVRTGSRGALLAIAALGLMFFWRASFAGKARIALLAAVGLGVGYFLMPAALKDRFVTTFSGEYLTASGELQATALASKEQRLMLLEHSLLLTFTHPFFGVGPGQFQVASSQEPEQQGIAWRETHNAFTQVSSEMGLPGFLLYVAALWCCFRITGALARASRAPGLEDLGAMAYCMRLSLVCFTVTSMFSSVAYAFYFPTLAGLTVALDAVGQREILARAASVSVPAPPVTPPVAPPADAVSPVRNPSPGLASKPKGLRPAG